MSELEVYLAVSKAAVAGIGIGWFLAGFSQPFPIRVGFIAMLLFFGVAWAADFLVVPATP